MKYMIWAERSANSFLGAAGAWLKHEGVPRVFSTMAEAGAEAARLNSNLTTRNVIYTAQPVPEEVTGDVHRQAASLLFGVPEHEVTEEMRRRAKTIMSRYSRHIR